jgi:hypothetical protein
MLLKVVLMCQDSWKLTKYERCIMSDAEVEKENVEMWVVGGQGMK